jgi:hypothetical protein
MATVPQSTKDSLERRLAAHARTRRPEVAGLRFRHRGTFAWIDAELPDGEIVPMIRLRYLGSAEEWGFGLYLASSDKYEDQILPTGSFTGTPEEALDCACELYLDAPDF